MNNTNWTREDLPRPSQIMHKSWRRERFGAEAALDAVVEHLNKHRPKCDRSTVTREDIAQAVRRGHNMLNAEVGVINEMCDLLGIEARQDTDPDPVEVAIRDGLYLWGFTDKAVQEIAASVRRVLGSPS